MMRWIGRAAAAMVISALSLTTGCGNFWVYPGSSSSSSSSSADYVYVANAYSSSTSTTESVAGFTVGSGTLTAVANSPYGLSYFPSAIAVNPADTYLFVAGSGLISTYSIGSGGALTAVSQISSGSLVAMDISPDGNWLVGLDANGYAIDEYQIQSTGALDGASGTTYSIQNATITPRAIKFAPSGDYLFVALGPAGDLVYSVSSGALTQQGTLGPLTSPYSDNALAVDPSSSTLYVARANSTSAGTLVEYSIGTNGKLTQNTTATATTGVQPYSVVLNSGGTDVYVANRTDDNISGFSIGSNGALTALSGSPYSSGSSVIALLLDKSGDYLLAASSGGGPDLAIYSFDATTAGKLDLVTSTTTGTDPTGPVAIAGTH